MTGIERKTERVIIELCSGDIIMAMWDDGTVGEYATPAEALTAVRRRAQRRNRGITVTTIEWRHGLQPPTN